jgi:hypothetical protein
MVDKVDVTSVAVGQSKTDWGKNGKSKPSAKGKAPRSPLASPGSSGAGGNSNKLPSGTYKA